MSFSPDKFVSYGRNGLKIGFEVMDYNSLVNYSQDSNLEFWTEKHQALVTAIQDLQEVL